MLQQIYRRPPCRRAISIKLCSNIIEKAHLLRGCLLDLLTDFNRFIQNSLEKLLFVILTFLQVHKNNSSFAFVCICTENKIQLQISSKHIYSHSNKQWTHFKYSKNTFKYSSFCFGVLCKEKLP